MADSLRHMKRWRNSIQRSPLAVVELRPLLPKWSTTKQTNTMLSKRLGKRLSPRGSRSGSRSPFQRGVPRNAPTPAFAGSSQAQARLLKAADSLFMRGHCDRRPCPRDASSLASVRSLRAGPTVAFSGRLAAVAEAFRRHSIWMLRTAWHRLAVSSARNSTRRQARPCHYLPFEHQAQLHVGLAPAVAHGWATAKRCYVSFS